MNKSLLLSSQKSTSTTPVLSSTSNFVNMLFLVDLEHVAHDLHLMQLGAVDLLRTTHVALRHAAELLHGQRDGRLTALALHVGWLLKGGRIKAAQKVISQCLHRYIAEFLERGRSGQANRHT
jgi:fatty acid-binding protein DegV